jgi:hypothetical protein
MFIVSRGNAEPFFAVCSTVYYLPFLKHLCEKVKNNIYFRNIGFNYLPAISPNLLNGLTRLKEL